MKTSTFHQHAEGQFAVDVKPGTSHCGLNDSRGQFSYTVDIRYSGNALDSRGFLLDNTDFQRYFQSLPEVDYSCELLAERSCQHFVDALGDRLEHVISVAVRIAPFAGVYVESEVTP